MSERWPSTPALLWRQIRYQNTMFWRSPVAAFFTLILAGILERQVDELRQAYAPWLALEVLDSLDGWVLMGGQRTLNDDR